MENQDASSGAAVGSSHHQRPDVQFHRVRFNPRLPAGPLGNRWNALTRRLIKEKAALKVQLRESKRKLQIFQLVFKIFSIAEIEEDETRMVLELKPVIKEKVQKFLKAQDQEERTGPVNMNFDGFMEDLGQLFDEYCNVTTAEEEEKVRIQEENDAVREAKVEKPDAEIKPELEK